MPARRRAPLQVRQLIVELDLHPHGSERLDEVRLVRRHKAGMARLKDHLGGRIEHLITQPSLVGLSIVLTTS